jgi:multimeric flavodoxin WrbA
MKMLGIVGSPRKGGNTERLISEALSVASAEGIETEMVRLGELSIQGCDACQACRKVKRCVVKDDFQPVYDRMVAADAIIVGSPVYFSSPTPNVLALLHRAGYVAQAAGRPFERKVGGPIVVARRAGQNFALAQMMFFFLHQGMIDLVPPTGTSPSGARLATWRRTRKGSRRSRTSPPTSSGCCARSTSSSAGNQPAKCQEQVRSSVRCRDR